MFTNIFTKAHHGTVHDTLSTIFHLLYVNVWTYLDVTLLLWTLCFFLVNLCNNSNFTCTYALYDSTYSTSGGHLTNLWIHRMQYMCVCVRACACACACVCVCTLSSATSQIWILTLSSHVCLHLPSVLLRSLNQNFECVSPIYTTHLTCLIILHFFTVTILGEEYKLWSSLLCYFSQPIYPVLTDLGTFLHILFSNGTDLKY
jgi:hypothetical protein